MKSSSTSLLVFGLYLIGMGAGFVLMPDTVLGIFGFPATDEIWPRVVGVLALVLAFYYISASRANLRTFAQWTVPARIGVFVFFTAFVILGLVGPVMIMLGSVDLLGALWTAVALKAEK
jgi:hypothetical protein